MNFIIGFLSLLWDQYFFARNRIRCIRYGHRFLCITDGHLCTKCGRFWGFYD